MNIHIHVHSVNMHIHSIAVINMKILMKSLEKCDILSTLVSKFSKINTCDLYYNNPHSLILSTRKFYLFKKYVWAGGMWLGDRALV